MARHGTVGERRPTLRRRVLLFTASIIVGLALTTLGHAAYQAYQLADENVERALREAEERFDAFLADEAARLRPGLQVLGDDPTFVTEVLTGDPETARGLLSERAAALMADALLATDAHGTLVATSTPTPAVLAASTGSLVKRVLSRGAVTPVLGTVSAEGRVYTAAAAPLRFSGRTVGTIVAARLLSAEALGRATQSHAEILSGALRQGPVDDRHDGERMRGTVRHLLSPTGEVVASVRLVRSLDAELAPFARFRLSLLVAAFSVMAVALGLASVGARRITEPLVTLTRLAEHIGEGSWSGEAPESSTDEIGALGRAFNRMRTGIVLREEQIRRTEALLQQAHRVEAIGRLAGGVAHDFNNILGVITGYGELAQRQIGPEHPASARLDQMIKAAERAAGLTRQLLAFSRKQVMQPKVLDLNGIVGDTQNMLGRLIGEDIEVVVHTAPRLGTVKADPGQIEQVILNLAVNARDAMPKGGSLTLETANVGLDEDYATTHPPVKAGRYVMLAVSDTGVGMDEETQLRIFEPFFTTKPEGQGTGLGLATVYGIVKQSAGYIWVYSEPGRGTTFKVYLPRVDAPGEPAQAAVPPAAAPRGDETILLVEDTETLRDVIHEVLEEQGYTVLLSSQGEEALDLAREHKGPIHLLLTDVVMPRLSGGDLAKLLMALRPEVQVLYMSGYTEGAISHQGVLGEGIALLEKPFNADRLARAVREALARPARRG